MKPPPFEYHAATSVDEVLALLGEHGDEAKVLAGGQSLMPLLSLRLARPAYLVDINRVDGLADVNVNGTLRVGAMVRHRVAEHSDAVRAASPLLAEAATHIGHAAIRNRGTLGGSVAHADPSAELPAVLVALGAEIEARSTRGTRTIAAADFFEGFLTTALEGDELLTAINLPRQAARTGSAFKEFSRRSGDFAIAGAAVTLTLAGDGKVGAASIAFSGVASVPVRAEAAEAMLVGQVPDAQLFEAAGKQAGADLDPPTDLHGTAAYRRHLASALARRALEQAYTRAQDGNA